MPAVWSTDSFVEGGVKSITFFRGRLRSTEEDVEGKFGPQVQLSFYDVRDLEAADGYTCEDGEFDYFVKQSNKSNSTNGRMIKQWAEFVGANKLGPLPNCLYDIDLEWKGVEYDFGPDNNPGKALIPVKLLDGKPATGRTSTKAAPAPAPDTSDYEIPDELKVLVLEAVGEDGGTRDIIRRAVSTKPAFRKLVADAPGGLDGVLAAMVAGGHLKQDDEYYFKDEEAI